MMVGTIFNMGSSPLSGINCVKGSCVEMYGRGLFRANEFV